MSNKPQRQWAYELIERWNRGDRKHLTSTCYEIAFNAVRMDEIGYAERKEQEAE